MRLKQADMLLQIVKYPNRDEVESDQGVGPHFDGGFLTFVRDIAEHPTPLFMGNRLASSSDGPQRPSSPEPSGRMDRRSACTIYFCCQHWQRSAPALYIMPTRCSGILGLSSGDSDARTRAGHISPRACSRTRDWTAILCTILPEHRAKPKTRGFHTELPS